MLINNPTSIMKKFENSHFFKEYFYLLKVNKAIIIKELTVTKNIVLNDLHCTYFEIINL